MARPRKGPLVDGGAELLPAAEAAPGAAASPAKERKPKREPKTEPPAAALTAAGPSLAAPAAKPKVKAKPKRKEDPGPTFDFDAAGVVKSQVLDGPGEIEPAPAVVPAPQPAQAKPAAVAPVAAAPVRAPARAPAQAAHRAQPKAAVAAAPAAARGAVPETPSPRPEPRTAGPATAEVRYPHRQGPADPPPRRSAPQPIERPVVVERAVPSAPRPLSMAELADRQRQTRELARPPERDAPGQRPAPVSMQERAMRYRPVAEPEQKQAVAPAAEAQPDRKGHEDSQARALDAARHKREPVAPGAVATPSAPAWEQRGPTGGATVVLVTRNHAVLIENRLRSWREVLPEVDLRWAVLDLGSTDATAQRVEEFPGVRLLVRAGGLVEPALALTTALKGLTGDAIVLVDAEAEPDSVVEALLRALKAGAAVAVAPRHRPDFLAISRASWEANGQPPLADLPRWAASHGGLVRFGGMGGTERPRSLVQRLCPDSAPVPRWDLRRYLPTRIRNLLNRFGVLGGAPK